MKSILSLKMPLRSLKKRPAFFAVIVFTFAIVYGTSIVVYSYIDALLFSPLPFKESERLVRIHSLLGGKKGLLSYPEFLDMQKELVSIEDLAVYRDGGRYNLSGDDQPPEELTTTFASSNLFKVLGVKPQIGNYWPGTLDEKGSHTVMLTHDFWQRRFGGNEKVEGIEITLDGFSYSNYGVLPQGFSFPGRNEAFRAMAFADFVVDSRDFRPCIGLARLKQGISLEDINKELKNFAEEQQRRHLNTNLGISFVAEPLSDLFIGDIYGYLLLLGAAGLFLLIIAAVNVSNLIVSQAVRQSRETVVRKVLGASNFLIIKDFVMHSFILSLMGSLTGLILAWFLIEASYGLVSPYLPYWINVGINQSVLLYTFVIAILFGIATGVIPWFFLFSGSNLTQGLKEGQQTTGSKRQHSLQKGLAILQIFVSVLLLIGGSLLFRSFSTAQQAELGFEPDQRLTFRIALAWYEYRTPEKKRAFFESSLRRIEAIPGVENVAMNSVLPLSDIVKTSTQSQSTFTVEGQSYLAQSENPFISIQRVTPNYFEVMGIGIEQGASFNPSDNSSHRYQVIIDKQLAEKMWPDDYALGKRIKLGSHGSDAPYLTIIGIADDVKHQSITSDNIPSIYVSILSNTTTDAYYVLKSRLHLSDLELKLRSAILAIDENQPTFEYLEMGDRVELKNWQSKVSSILFLTIAIIGSVIAAVGLFSTMTFTLMLRVKELALRRVFGATDRSVLQLVMKDMLRISGAGIAFGLLLSPMLLKPIVPFLFEVNLIDVSVYTLVAGAFLFVSLLATLTPFWKALYINPVTVLRRD